MYDNDKTNNVCDTTDSVIGLGVSSLNLIKNSSMNFKQKIKQTQNIKNLTSNIFFHIFYHF